MNPIAKSIIIFLILSSVKCADIHRIRRKHQHQYHKPSIDHDSTSATEIFSFEPAKQHEEYRGEMPLQIWKILAANSHQLNRQNQTSETDSDNAIDNVSQYIEANDNVNFDLPSSYENEADKLGVKSQSDSDNSLFNCPKCKEKNLNLGEYELTKLRIEYIKNEILNKLRLHERPPKKDMVDELPEPIQDGYNEGHEDIDDNQNSISNVRNVNAFEEYFAKTTQKIIFLTQDWESHQVDHDEPDKCNRFKSVTGNPSLCFSFVIPQDVDITSIDSAQLWVNTNKNPNTLDSMTNHTILLSDADESEGKLNPITFTKTNPLNHDWEKIDIANTMKVWLEKGSLEHMIHITCDDCSSSNLPISTQNDTKPFIVIDTIPQKSISRQRRNVNCNPQSTECCRDSLYIDFAEIGWSDWIISPKGYHAYFCRGTCARISSITQSESDHATAIQRLLHSNKSKNTKVNELVPCCTATKYSSLQIVYLDSNNTGNTVILPRMIVESCGCS